MLFCPCAKAWRTNLLLSLKNELDIAVKFVGVGEKLTDDDSVEVESILYTLETLILISEMGNSKLQSKGYI